MPGSLARHTGENRSANRSQEDGANLGQRAVDENRERVPSLPDASRVFRSPPIRSSLSVAAELIHIRHGIVPKLIAPHLTASVG